MDLPRNVYSAEIGRELVVRANTRDWVLGPYTIRAELNDRPPFNKCGMELDQLIADLRRYATRPSWHRLAHHSADCLCDVHSVRELTSRTEPTK